MRGSASFLRSLRVNERSYMSWCQMLSTVRADDLHRFPDGLHTVATERRWLLAGKLRHMFLFITLNKHTHYFHE